MSKVGALGGKGCQWQVAMLGRILAFLYMHQGIIRAVAEMNVGGRDPLDMAVRQGSVIKKVSDKGIEFFSSPKSRLAP